MPYAIELYFDDNSSKIINCIKDEYIKRGLIIDEGSIPHISLGIYEDINLNDFMIKLEKFSKSINQFEITFSSIGMFITEKPVIFLAPVVTKKLLDIHIKFYEFFIQDEKAMWVYYKPNNWVPHTTLAMDIDDSMIKETIDINLNVTFPIKAKVTKIGILQFKPNKRIVMYNIGNN